jgi:hypothetical protein
MIRGWDGIDIFLSISVQGKEHRSYMKGGTVEATMFMD